MCPDLPRVQQCSRLMAAAFSVASAVAMPALAQEASATPETRAPATVTPTTKAPASPPRQRIELPAAERQALEAGGTPRTPAGPTQADLVPSTADARAAPPEEAQTRIEQVRTSNRISEVRVTPALTGRTYTISNREGRQPTSAVETSPGLSVPKFFTFEWGRADERPAPALPPPPSSSTPR